MSPSLKENQKPYENITRIKINPHPISVLKSRVHSPKRHEQKNDSPILTFYKSKERRNSSSARSNIDVRENPSRLNDSDKTEQLSRESRLSKQDRLVHNIYLKKSMLPSNKNSLFKDIYKILEENIESSNFLVDLFVQIQEYERQVEQEMIRFMRKMDPECSVSEIDNCLVSTLNDFSTLLIQRNNEEKKQTNGFLIDLEEKLRKALDQKHFLSNELSIVHNQLESKKYKYKELKKELNEINQDFQVIVKERDQFIKRGIQQMENVTNGTSGILINSNNHKHNDEISQRKPVQLQKESFNIVEIQSRSVQKIEKLIKRLQHSNNRGDMLEERNKMLNLENKEAKEICEKLQQKSKNLLCDLHLKESELRTLRGSQINVKDYNQIKNQLHYTLEECEALKFELTNLQEKFKEKKSIEKEYKKLQKTRDEFQVTKEKETFRALNRIREVSTMESICIPAAQYKNIDEASNT